MKGLSGGKKSGREIKSKHSVFEALSISEFNIEDTIQVFNPNLNKKSIKPFDRGKIFIHSVFGEGEISDN